MTKKVNLHIVLRGFSEEGKKKEEVPIVTFYWNLYMISIVYVWVNDWTETETVDLRVSTE